MGGVKKVLLVDDDCDFLEFNRIALEKSGYAVYTAFDSSEALDIAVRILPDAAVLDIMMNKSNEGFELARLLRKNPATATMPIIMLSSINEINRSKGLAYSFTDNDKDDFWLPIDMFLDKPIKPKQLLEILSEVMERKIEKKA